MDRQELLALITKGPVKILMNDGLSYEVPSAEFATVSDIAASILFHADDGKLRHIYLPLVTMSGVQPLAEPSDF